MLIKITSLVVTLLLSFTSSLQADFYVIPVSKKIKNVVIVAKSGGQYTDIQTALDSISDANYTNPYLLYIGPGQYNITTPIQMKPYVSITGSGKNSTLLYGNISADAIDSTSATMIGTHNTALSQLTLSNSGSNYASALYNDNIYSMKIEDANIYASADHAYGIYNVSSSLSIKYTEIYTVGGNYSYGIYNNTSSPTIDNVEITATGKYASSYGVYNYPGSDPIISNTKIKASGITRSRGIYNLDSRPTIFNTVINATGGTNSHYGIFNDANANPIIRYCIIEGGKNAIRGGQVSLSTIINGGQNAQCNLCVNKSGTTTGADCN